MDEIYKIKERFGYRLGRIQPFETKCKVKYRDWKRTDPTLIDGIGVLKKLDYDTALFEIDGKNYWVDAENITPILIPIKYMTPEILIRMSKDTGMTCKLSKDKNSVVYIYDSSISRGEAYSRVEIWLNRNHYDYYGLIDEGLACETKPGETYPLVEE